MSQHRQYRFTLRYKLTDAEAANIEGVVERLGANGCTDALVGTGMPGRLALDFNREADSAEAAVLSGMADVRRAVPSAQLIEAGPDLTGLTDVAELVGVSRQYMRQLMLSDIDSFPAPVHDGASTIWHLADVLGWLLAKGRSKVDAGVLETARVAMQVNLAKEDMREVSPTLRREIRALVVA